MFGLEGLVALLAVLLIRIYDTDRDGGSEGDLEVEELICSGSSLQYLVLRCVVERYGAGVNVLDDSVDATAAQASGPKEYVVFISMACDPVFAGASKVECSCQPRPSELFEG